MSFLPLHPVRVARDAGGQWSRPPAFESGGGGLVSTADDYLAFATALLAGGTHRGERVLPRAVGDADDQ